jgi:2-amino-4-hydroxy-6-hydroxymethyldihydropteridine diphosphokinase
VKKRLTDDNAVNDSARPPNRDEAFVALGSNRGDRRAALRGAVRSLGEHEAVQHARPSPVYESEAHTQHPGETQPAYLNAVVQLQTTLSPEALLDLAWRLEADAGRDRAAEEGRWQPRPLDVDLLVCGRATRSGRRLRLPHPRLAERRFVLRPWADLAPNLRVPAPFDDPVQTLLARCPDRTALRCTTLAL